MPIVLVVDDSEVDRRLIQGLLGRDVDCLIEYAENGREAMDRLQNTFPDLVITDLVMPEMDGIELVTTVRDSFPNVPVILVTGHGSESLAVEALDRGAASYVPKSQLSEKLSETVKQVLGMAKGARCSDRLNECLASHQYTFNLDYDPTLITALVDLVQQTLLDLEFCHTTKRMHIGIALEEALLNALYHGNLELSEVQWRDHRLLLREGDVSTVVAERCTQSPYAARRTYVHVDVSHQKAQFVIRDQGRGFDVAAVPKPRDPTTLEAKGGRGLVLMRNFMDHVTFNETGNEVTMVVLPDARGS